MGWDGAELVWECSGHESVEQREFAAPAASRRATPPRGKQQHREYGQHQHQQCQLKRDIDARPVLDLWKLPSTRLAIIITTDRDQTQTRACWCTQEGFQEAAVHVGQLA